MASTLSARSSAVPLDCISKTRRPLLASSTTLPGTCASIVSARSMQTADPLHMSLVKSYVPAATKILSTALSPTAAVSSATVLTETWLSFRPCSTRGPEGGRPSVTISPRGMLATATDSWTRLRSVAALVCICRATRGCYLGAGAGPTVCVCVCATHPGALCGCAACEARRSLERGGRGRHAPQVAETAAAHRRVCVIAGLRVSGMPASTGRREQSVCFFAGGGSCIPVSGESCWTSGREAEARSSPRGLRR